MTGSKIRTSTSAQKRKKLPKPSSRTARRERTASVRPWEDGLKIFLASWRQHKADVLLDAERLTGIFNTLSPLLPRAPKASEPREALNYDSLQAGFRELAEPLSNARDEGVLINPWTVAGLKRAEVRNAAVLASLWEQNAGGATATAFLDAFLRRLRHEGTRTLPSIDDLRRGYVVQTEHCPTGDQSERVDITIEGEDFIIGLEVKIDAAEGPAQLERYVRSLDERARARRKTASIIFLAPFRPTAPEGSAAGWLGRVLPADWSDVVAAARTSVPQRAANRNFNHQLIIGFAAHVASFRKGRK